MERDTKIIAVAGKGGVGKTSISAAFVRLLTERYPDARILAIDADPAVGLSTALGVEVTETLDDIRKGIVHSVENGAQRQALEMRRDFPPWMPGCWGRPTPSSSTSTSPATATWQ